jgi:hypothetical protein
MLKRILMIMALIAVCVPFYLGCDSNDDANSATIIGTVKGETGVDTDVFEPIPGATVRSELGPATLTGADGTYEFQIELFELVEEPHPLDPGRTILVEKPVRILQDVEFTAESSGHDDETKTIPIIRVGQTSSLQFTLEARDD